MYDVFIDGKDLALIRKQTTKLISLSETMESWTASAYGDIMRIVNTGTLQAIQKCWQNHLAICNTVRNQEEIPHFRNALAAEFGDLNKSQLAYHNLSKAFGPLSNIGMQYSRFYTEGFYKLGIHTGFEGALGQYNRVNPLVLYSLGGEDVPSLKCPSVPAMGYHLATPLSPLASDSPYHTVLSQRPAPASMPLPKLFEGGIFPAIEFGSWCDAFKEFIRDPERAKRLRLRFFAGEATACCFGLAGIRDPSASSPLATYAQPISGERLIIDGADYLPDAAEPAPLSFNVVDASDLPTSTGLLNIFVSVIPLLVKSPSTVLFTEAHDCPPKEQLKMLENILLGDVGAVCTLFGMAPLGYMTGFSTRGYPQDNGIAYLGMNLSAHLVWKFTTSGDPAVDKQEKPRYTATPCYDAKDLAKLLLKIHDKMFPFEVQRAISIFNDFHETKNPAGESVYPAPMYTRRSFAAMLQFLKTRVCVNWTKVMNFIITPGKMIGSPNQLFTGSSTGFKTIDSNGISPSLLLT
jgi:hypothetical protein